MGSGDAVGTKAGVASGSHKRGTGQQNVTAEAAGLQSCTKAACHGVALERDGGLGVSAALVLTCTRSAEGPKMKSQQKAVSDMLPG